MKLDPNKPLETRSNYPVRIYDTFYQRYFVGAYYDRDTNIWFARNWDWDGTDSLGEKSLDLYNVK